MENQLIVYWRKNLTTQHPKMSHNKPLVCQQQAGPGGKVSHHQVNAEDKGKARVENDRMMML